MTIVTSAVAAIAATILGAIILLRWTPRNHFQIQWLWYESRDVSSLRHVTVLLHNPAPFTLLVGVTTLVVYTTLIAQIRQYRGLQRQEPDRLRTIRELLKIGDVDQSELLIDRLFNGAPGPQTFEAFDVRVGASLASRNLEQAWNDQALWFTVKSLTQYRDELARGGADDIYFRLMKQLSRYGIEDQELCVDLLRLGTQHGVTDGCQVVVLRELGQTLDQTGPGDRKRLLYSVGINTGQYPMTHLWANVVDGKERGWADLIRFKTTTTGDALARLLLIQQNLPATDYAADERERIVHGFCDELVQLSESNWPYWQRWSVISVLFNILLRCPESRACVERIPPIIRSLIGPLRLPFANEVESTELALAGVLRQPPLDETRRVRVARWFVNQGAPSSVDESGEVAKAA